MVHRGRLSRDINRIIMMIIFPGTTCSRLISQALCSMSHMTAIVLWWAQLLYGSIGLEQTDDHFVHLSLVSIIVEVLQLETKLG